MKLKLVLSLVLLSGCTNVPSSTLPTSTTQDAPRVTVLAEQPPRSPEEGVGNLHEGRSAHTATLLGDGRVLIVGGFGEDGEAVPTAEMFDPADRSFAVIAGPVDARQSHTATALADGTVLIAGGLGADYLSSAELFDPETGRFSSLEPMNQARSGHRAVLLSDNRVLLVGGTGEGWTFLNTAEIFDPETGLFTMVGGMVQPRESHTATLLPNGTVLVIGGHMGRRSDIEIFATSEIFDPVSETFIDSGALSVRRHKHDATLLADGRVLVTGGADEADALGAYTSAEVYDPSTGLFQQVSSMSVARFKHTDSSVLLADGRVLLTGGANVVEIYDPANDSYELLTEGAGTTRLFSSATKLLSGEVLITGGYGPGVRSTRSVWLLSADRLG